MAQLIDQIDREQTRWAFGGYVAATDESVGQEMLFGRVVGDDDWLLSSGTSADMVVGIGHPQVRARALQAYIAAGQRFSFPNLIHPSATLDPRSVTLGRGNIVTAGCIFTCDIEIGDFNLFNWQTTVGHDARVGSFSVLNPSVNVSGGVAIGDRVLVGTGAQILEGRVVGSDATVGAGAVVTQDVDPASTVVGIPARPIATKA
jgi:sugar O-acyltransferase (sialic acid O-acetyltransferase NeuD family)